MRVCPVMEYGFHDKLALPPSCFTQLARYLLSSKSIKALIVHKVHLNSNKVICFYMGTHDSFTNYRYSFVVVVLSRFVNSGA